jgi:hypothetical protein
MNVLLQVEKQIDGKETVQPINKKSYYNGKIS